MTTGVKKTTMTVLAVLLFLQSGFLSAEEKKPAVPPRAGTVTHILGDQSFIFELGALIPMFFVRFADGAAEFTNLSIGPKASIEYMNYLSNSVALGVELTGGFCFSPNFNIYWTLPITAKIIYIIYIERMQLFLDMGLGINLQKFLEYGHVDLFARPHVAFYFPIDPTLDLGIGVGYWFIPQFATADQPQDQSRLGNFLDISLSLIYHF